MCESKKRGPQGLKYREEKMQSCMEVRCFVQKSTGRTITEDLESGDGLVYVSGLYAQAPTSWGHAHQLGEGTGEMTLIREAACDGDFRQGGFRMLK